MIKSYIFILAAIFYLLTISCNNNDNSTTADNDTINVDSINWDSMFVEIFVIEELKRMNKKVIPAKLRRIVNDKNNKYFCNVIDNYTVNYEIPNYFYAFVKIFWDEKNIKYYCISCMERDTLKNITHSYFYFLKYEKEKWKNVTHLLLPNYTIDIIKIQTSFDFVYKRVYPKENFFAYKCSTDSLGVIIDSENEIMNFILTNNFSQHLYKEITFLDILWDARQFKIANINNPLSGGLLSETQLETQKRYTSLEQALKDSSQVYILDISGQNITDIPQEINKLTNLQIFIFNDNKITKIPEQIAELKNLQVLQGDNNLLTYLPYEIGECTQLDEISLSYNKIYTLPNSFAGLKKLAKINLQANSFKEFPIQITFLKRLVICNLASNYITFIPAEISNCKRINYFNLSNNLLDEIPKEISSLANLKEINLLGNNFNQKKISHIKTLLPYTNIIF